MVVSGHDNSALGLLPRMWSCCSFTAVHTHSDVQRAPNEHDAQKLLLCVARRELLCRGRPSGHGRVHHGLWLREGNEQRGTAIGELTAFPCMYRPEGPCGGPCDRQPAGVRMQFGMSVACRARLDLAPS